MRDTTDGELMRPELWNSPLTADARLAIALAWSPLFSSM